MPPTSGTLRNCAPSPDRELTMRLKASRNGTTDFMVKEGPPGLGKTLLFHTIMRVKGLWSSALYPPQESR